MNAAAFEQTTLLQERLSEFADEVMKQAAQMPARSGTSC